MVGGWHAGTVSSSVFATAVLVQGAETLLSDRAVASRVTAATRERPEAEVIRVAGGELDAGRFVEASGGSLLSAATVLVISQADEIDRSLHDLVAQTAAQPPEDLCLVIVHPGGVKGKGLVDRLRKGGVEIVKADPLRPWKVPEFISAEARRCGVDLDRSGVEALHRALGSDLRTVASAVAQLASDTEPGRRLDAEAVATYFGGRVEVTAFAVSDACLDADLSGALESLRWARTTGVAAVLVTSALATGLRRLGLFLDLRTQRLDDRHMAQVIGVPPWTMKDLSRQARRWNAKSVARALTEVARADAAVKGAQVDPDHALEAMLIAVDGARRDATGRRAG